MKKGLMELSINLTDDEKMLAECYARRHSCSLAEAFKKALFDKIEDECDFLTGLEAYDEYNAGQKKSRPIADLWKECDI